MLRKADVRTLWEEKSPGVFDCAPGSRIDEAIDEAIELARQRSERVSFEFNGVTVMVEGGSSHGLLYRDWSRAMSGYIDGPVGPFPGELTAADLSSDAAKLAEEERRRAASSAVAREKWATRKATLDERLSNASPLDLAKPTEWAQWVAKNTDPYGSGVIVYAERWARIMQAEMAAGKELEDIAESTSHDADVDGITGFMYGCAVSGLARMWAHGERLRRWHNLKTQLRDEGERANESGGVLNPAVFSIGPAQEGGAT